MVDGNVEASQRRILREIQQENVSLTTILEFRRNYTNSAWTELIYKKTGDSILHIAARLGQVKVVEYILLEWAPACVDFRNNDSKTPLHEACQFSRCNVVELLLRNGAQVDAIKRADWTPLMLACTKPGAEAFETVRVLLRGGARLGLRNKDGWTALHVASRTGDLEIIQLLLEHDKEAVARRSTNNGRTILHIACLHGHLEVVKLILQRNLFSVRVKDNCGNTVVHDAACSGNIELVQFLHATNCDVNAPNNASLTCLHLAAGEGLLLMIKYLITALKMDVNILTASKLTPLHCAARRKQDDAFKLLITLGADVNMCDCHGRLPQQYYNLQSRQ